MQFGGDGAAYLCPSLGSDFTHSIKARGPEECKPVLASLVGKALGYSDEYPDLPFNPDTVKPLLCARGGRVSARFGGGKKTESTSLDVTATLMGCGNYPLRLPPGTEGMDGKVYNVTPTFIFKNPKQVTAASHVAADQCFMETLTSGAFRGEYLWVMARLFSLIHDTRIIGGRDFWPVPGPVRENMQHIAKLSGVQADGGDLAALKGIYFEVKNSRQADNRELVVKALEHFGQVLNKPAEHMISEMGLSVERARTLTGKSLYRVLAKQTPDAKKVYLRLTKTARDVVLEKYGGQLIRKAGVKAVDLKSLPTAEDHAEEPTEA